MKSPNKRQRTNDSLLGADLLQAAPFAAYDKVVDALAPCVVLFEVRLIHFRLSAKTVDLSDHSLPESVQVGSHLNKAKFNIVIQRKTEDTKTKKKETWNRKN